MVETISRENISKEDAAWLAGMIEGDGSLYINKHQLTHGKITFRSTIAVCNTDYRIIRAVSILWGKLGCKFYYGLHKTKNGFALAITACGMGTTNKILDLIIPYLKAKRDQADLLKEFNSHMGQGRYQRFGIDYYKALQLKYVDKLHSLRINSVNPQRLQRTASQPLEMMV